MSTTEDFEMQECPACGFPRSSHPITRNYETGKIVMECAEFGAGEPDVEQVIREAWPT